jgi:putative transposase
VALLLLSRKGKGPDSAEIGNLLCFARLSINPVLPREIFAKKLGCKFDNSGANTAAIDRYNSDGAAVIELRQIKYLNNVVEQDHRAVKRIIRPMLGFKSFRSARNTLAGIEIMHMIRKGQLQDGSELTPAHQFYSLAA